MTPFSNTEMTKSEFSPGGILAPGGCGGDLTSVVEMYANTLVQGPFLSIN